MRGTALGAVPVAALVAVLTAGVLVPVGGASARTASARTRESEAARVDRVDMGPIA